MIPDPGFTVFGDAPSCHSKGLAVGENTNAHGAVLAGFSRQSRARNNLIAGQTSNILPFKNLVTEGGVLGRRTRWCHGQNGSKLNKMTR
jgi:hypothetical protein